MRILLRVFWTLLPISAVWFYGYFFIRMSGAALGLWSPEVIPNSFLWVGMGAAAESFAKSAIAEFRQLLRVLREGDRSPGQ